jgi:hypothetical protein
MSNSFIDINKLDAFLRAANLNTYANEHAPKVLPSRPGSSDYHFEKDGLVYHDTYFGGSKFIGEEIVYEVVKPIWGMNYYGFTVDDTINEKLFDEILRPALMSGSGDNIPVRGPKEFMNKDWRYAFVAEGNLKNFTGKETISKNGIVVCRLYCHGGFIV